MGIRNYIPLSTIFLEVLSYKSVSLTGIHNRGWINEVPGKLVLGISDATVYIMAARELT
jgi:hypothetical protein